MAKPQAKQSRALSNNLKVTVSGSYKTANKMIENFENVVGIIPRMDDDKVAQQVIRRYALIWISQARKKGPDGKPTEDPKYAYIQKIRQVFIDSVEDYETDTVDGEDVDMSESVLSYVGKNIMDMNTVELQDFAAANDLSGVPLHRVTSLVQTRRMAFSEYAIKVLNLFEADDPKSAKPQNLYDWKVKGFNPNRFEDIIADSEIRRQSEPMSVEDGLDYENERLGRSKKPSKNDNDDDGGTGSRLTLADLKGVAKGRNITFHDKIGYKELYKKIYGVTQAA